MCYTNITKQSLKKFPPFNFHFLLMSTKLGINDEVPVIFHLAPTFFQI